MRNYSFRNDRRGIGFVDYLIIFGFLAAMGAYAYYNACAAYERIKEGQERRRSKGL